MGKTRHPRQVRRKPRADAVSIEELIRQQGVKPVHDLDELGRLLPPEADPDDLLAFLKAERAARRKAPPKQKL